jgi:hypothetical protein
MKRKQKFASRGNLIAGLTLLVMLTGCGGGESKNRCETDSFLVVIGCFVDLLPGSKSSQGFAPTDVNGGDGKISAPVSVVDGMAKITRVDEFESNNSPGNANILYLPMPGSVDPVGIEIAGSVNSESDARDFYILTPTRSGAHTIYLCAESCAEILQDDAAYIMIYDQGQSTIASTAVGTVEVLSLTADLVAGLAYYVEIHGYDTGGERYDYLMTIVD